MEPRKQKRAWVFTVLIAACAALPSVASVAAGQEVRLERSAVPSVSGTQQALSAGIFVLSSAGQSIGARARSGARATTIGLGGGYWGAPGELMRVAALGTLAGLALMLGGLSFGRRLRSRAARALAVALLLAVFIPQAGAVPLTVNFQGRVVLDGQAKDGTGYFKFALLDGPTTVVWSNDGKSPQPSEYLSLELSDGHFFVDLGRDMTALPVAALAGSDLRLRIWFAATQQEAGAGSFQQLGPDLVFNSVPFALETLGAQEALTASTVPAAGINGTITDSQVADTLTASALVSGTYSNGLTFSNASNHFSGDGSGLTNVTASTVPAAGISGTITDSQVADTLTASALVSGTYSNGLTFSNASNHFSGDGSGLTNVTAVSAGTLTRGGFATATLDSTDSVGQYGSITIGADGLGLISYYDETNKDLKVAHCNNAACSSAATATLDSAGSVGRYSSLTIGADGLGLISYFDETNGDLKVAHCGNAACSSAAIFTLDSAGSVGKYSSITIGADGFPLISYHDETNFDLKVAHCTKRNCSFATGTATLESAGSVGTFTSLTIGADGLGLISYYDETNQDLKVAHCATAACSSAATATLDSAGSVGRYSSITIGADGLGLISHYDTTNGDLKVTHCSNAACSSAATATLDSAGFVGAYNSITIGADGLGLISYFDASNADLKVAHCGNAVCSSATNFALDSAGGDTYSSLTIGADGLALISYRGTNGDLKVAHLSNSLGVPFFRRR